MAREVLYRRSFHAEIDLKGMESLLGLDRASAVRNAYEGTRISTVDGGFEAPRNSLDVPFTGLLEMRRNSEVRSEEIPIGYELSRSLTSRRRNEEYSNLKPLTANTDQCRLTSKPSTPKSDSELDHKHRAPSVVARLMGLDALPHQQTLEASSSRTVLPRECTSSSNLLTIPSEREASAEDLSKGKLGYGELSFRNHPQEKQLQEFKREFSARQALQDRNSVSSVNLEGFTLQQKKEQLLRLESQMDSEEFLDALAFLNANKDFFVKVLKDPQSSFAKHLQQPGGSFTSFENAPSKQAGGKLSRSSLEHNPLSLTDELAEWRKRQDLHLYSTSNKSKPVRGSRWGRDEEMPLRPRCRARGGSMKKGRMGLDHMVPTRIVVLKPHLGKQAYRKSSSVDSTVPLLPPDGILRRRFDGKENAKQELKDRTLQRYDGGLVKEYFGDDKDGAKDVRVIAKQIVKHVKEDMSQRLLKDGLYSADPFAPASYTGGRKVASQNSGGDASTITDGDGYFRTCRHHRFQNNREHEHHQQLGVNGRRNPAEECKRSSQKHVTSSTRSFREPCKVDEGMQDSCVKQSLKDSKILKKTGRSNSFKLRDAKPEAPRVLPRSLSAPAAASVENRALEREQKGGGATERATSLSKARSSESSPFKERLLSLKDSFSLTKKRANKKPNPPQCSLPLESPELSTAKQLPQEQAGARKETCYSLSGFKWQTDYSHNDVVTEVPEKPLEEVLHGNCMTPVGLDQWTSTTGEVVDTASDTSLDKCEQPSPVSVLETPFQESQSSAENRKMDPDRTERTCELTQLKCDHKNISRNLHAEFFSQPSSCHYSSFDCLTSELLNATKACLESYGLGYVALASGSEEETTYIMHVLSLSGLNLNGPILSQSLASEHVGVNPLVFGKLEAYYENRCRRGSRDHGPTPLDLSSRRLLFDFINEVVSSALKGRFSQPWAISSNHNVRLCTGKQLLEQIFTHISYHRFVPSEAEEEVLEDMASKELMREAPWVHSQSDTESVVIEIERLICGELIRELVHDCVMSS